MNKKTKDGENILAAIGISFINELCEIDAEEGFIKLDDSLAAQLDQLLGAIPELLLQQGKEDVFKVIFDKGLGELQRVKDNPLMYRGNVVKKGTNNKIVGGVQLQQLGNSAQIIANSMELASVLVGQYYMAKIDDKLAKLGTDVSDISRFLREEKKANLMGIDMFLSNVDKILSSVLTNEQYRVATLATLQSKKIETFSAIKLYEMQIVGMQEKIDKKDKVEEAFERITGILALISEYWYSVYLFCRAYALEVTLSGDTSDEYYETALSEMSEVCHNYQENYRHWKSVCSSYIDNLKALESNKVLEVGKNLKNMQTYGNNILNIMKAVGDIMDWRYEAEQDKKGKANEMFRKLLKEDKFKSIEAMEIYLNNIINMMVLNSGHVEVIKNAEGVFIKKDNLDLESVLSK